MRKKEPPCINFFDLFTPLVVWELIGARWKLIQVARPRDAIALVIALSKENPEKLCQFLVFPPGINPNKAFKKKSNLEPTFRQKRSHYVSPKNLS